MSWYDPRISITVQEQHPREQGLKHLCRVFIILTFVPVQEQHPREQGLKPFSWPYTVGAMEVQEQHPREQGLKPDVRPRIVSAILFKSNIHENKD